MLTMTSCGLLEKKIVVKAVEENKIVETIPARAGLSLTIKFMHSVQKTPVEEDLEFDGAGWVSGCGAAVHGVGRRFSTGRRLVCDGRHGATD